ncbi:MAG: leucine-rich repeat protein [Alphaproteobacteria bacterium]|jgi:predicted cupin superfamily sugar epimerase|nr:leucine-rich repeat domain-containing protein [Alphaproteobacteria bacterium]
MEKRPSNKSLYVFFFNLLLCTPLFSTPHDPGEDSQTKISVPFAEPQGGADLTLSIPDEVLCDVMSTLKKSKHLAPLPMVCQRWHQLLDAETCHTLRQKARTPDRGQETFLKRATRKLKTLFQQVLKEESYTYLPKKLQKHLHGETKIFSLELLDQNTLQRLYDKVFERSPYEVSQDDKLCLEAYLPVERIALFNTKPQTLKKVCDGFRPTSSFLWRPHREVTQDELDALKQTPHTLVVTQTELVTQKARLEELLRHNPEHRLHLVLSLDLYVDDEGNALSMKSENLPLGLQHLILSDPKGAVQSIDPKFLSHHPTLKTFEARHFPALKHIEGGFLSHCKNLTQFDAPGFENVIYIGLSFLSGCTRLKEFDSKPFVSVREIGHYFLTKCTDLTTFRARGFINLQKVGHCFLTGNTSLVVLKTKGFTKLRQVGHYFSSGCTSLPDIDSKGLRALQQVGSDFFAGCISVKHFDTTPFLQLQMIGEYLLSGCLTLERIEPQGLSNVKELGPKAFYNCPNLSPAEKEKLQRWFETYDILWP